MAHDDHFAQAIVATVDQPLLVLDSDLRVVEANSAFCDCFQVSCEVTRGKLVYELGNRQWDIPKLRELLRQTMTDALPAKRFRIEHRFESLGRRIMFLKARRLELPERPPFILLAISNVTEREDLLFNLESQKEFAEKLIDSVREGLLILRRDLRVRTANQSFYDLFQVSPEETVGRLVYEVGNRQWDIPKLRSLLEDILPEKTTFDDFAVEHEFERIGRRWMLLNARRLDHMNLIVLAIRDITEEQAARERQQMLTGELQHRVKNIINNVHALARQTRKRYRTLEEFFPAFVTRLEALARSQDRLVKSPTEAISLRDILEDELDAMGAHYSGQVSLRGPSVTLPPRDAQIVGLMVHELVTNAAKHGALSLPSGGILVTWRPEQREGRNWLLFDWRESGVEIGEPSPARGFGSEVIENSVPYMLGGVSELRIEPGGILCHLEFPLRGEQRGGS